MKKKLLPYLWVALILLLWEAVSRFGLVSEYILPPFSQVFIRMLSELTVGKVYIQVCNSLLLVLEGFLLSFVGAILIAVLCTWSKTLESFFSTLCAILNPLPGIALLPIIMMWFGIGDGAMLAMIVHGVLWPLVTNLITGFRSVPQIYRDWARNIGLSPFSMATNILIYSVMPYFISGMRIGWGRAWRALISAEMIFGMAGGLGGIGYYIYMNRSYADITNVLAGVLIIVMIGIVVDNLIFRYVETKTIKRWGMTNEE